MPGSSANGRKQTYQAVYGLGGNVEYITPFLIVCFPLLEGLFYEI